MQESLVGGGAAPAAASEPVAEQGRESGQWKLTYFDAPTRGEQLRLLFKVADVAFFDQRLEKYPQSMEPLKHAVMGDRSPLLFDQTPMVTSPSGVHVSQTAAAMQFVGRSLGLTPADPETDARALALTLGSEEFRNACFYKLFMGRAVRQVTSWKFYGLCCCVGRCCTCRERKAKNQFAKFAALFESALRNSAGAYFCGDKLCYADVAICDSVRETLDLDCFDRADVAVGETVILLHPPLPLVDVSIALERGCHRNNSLADG